MAADRVVVVSDEQVAGLYGDAAIESLRGAGLRADLLTFPAGEASKSAFTWAELSGRLFESGCGRDAGLVALGGGVTGDLAGFVAATYMRGIEFAIVPTTLLAMLDSSVGGKTGVNTPHGKNLLGAFHHPTIVLIDPDLLATLPLRRRRSGLAEAVKMAAILDDDFFVWCEDEAVRLAAGDPEALERLIETSVRAKAIVVADDPSETNRRQILNFGHTAAHALESLSGLVMDHGEAVALGMRLEARLGEAFGVTASGTAARLDALLARLELDPSVPPEATARSIVSAASTDKKRRAGVTRWVFLERIGAVARDAAGAWSHALEPAEVAAALAPALRAMSNVRDSSA